MEKNESWAMKSCQSHCSWIWNQAGYVISKINRGERKRTQPRHLPPHLQLERIARLDILLAHDGVGAAALRRDDVGKGDRWV
jgi:hypothetical protein